jgi:hypothetical protein
VIPLQLEDQFPHPFYVAFMPTWLAHTLLVVLQAVLLLYRVRHPPRRATLLGVFRLQMFAKDGLTQHTWNYVNGSSQNLQRVLGYAYRLNPSELDIA